MSEEAFAIDRSQAASPSPMVRAVLRELVNLLDGLAKDPTREGIIDLGSPPINVLDRRSLRSWLGRGEVEVVCDAAGGSSVHETAFPGVWWVVHYGPDRFAMVEQIVVARVPALLPAHPEDIVAGCRRLVERFGSEALSGSGESAR